MSVSDRRLKKNIQVLGKGIETVEKLRPCSYEWKDDKNNTTKLGLIAQEVKETLDNHNIEGFSGWHEAIDGVQGVSYEMFVVPLVKAVQELSSQVTDLKKEIEDLKG